MHKVGDSPIGVMHLTDSLAAGGAERMGVNLANLTPRDRFRIFYCTTRCDGPLSKLLAPDIGRLRLERRRTLELGAVRRLIRFIRKHDIQLLHAHQSSLFVAHLAACYYRRRSPPFPAVVWHDNFGSCEIKERSKWIYRLLTRRVQGVLAANQRLVEWAQSRLRLPPSRIWYVPNFVTEPTGGACAPDLPGSSGTRIACVAHLSPQKDHQTLVRAMGQVVQRFPHAHLLLVGGRGRPDDSFEFLQQQIRRRRLQQHITLLGERNDVPGILRSCDVGVLSSASEGLPLALLEYGLAGLPAVATRVGQCAEVLEDGQAGFLVPPRDSQRLASALLSLLGSAEQRKTLGERLRSRVRRVYSADRVIDQVCHVYRTILQ